MKKAASNQVPTSIPQLAVGMALGMVITFIAFSTWEYVSRQDISKDRNGDGKPDAMLSYTGGLLWSVKFDDDFDGYFETLQTYNRQGAMTRGEIDRNRDGKPDIIEHYTHGQLESADFLDPVTDKIKKRVFYKLGVKTREEIDRDGDGKFERTIEFDQFESPLK